jgi:hypothetical protein
MRNQPFRPVLWNLDVYAELLQEVEPFSHISLFRSRGSSFQGDIDFWAVPSPEPPIPTGVLDRLCERPIDDALIGAGQSLAAGICERYQPEKILFIAILRAGVPVAEWLTQLLPGSIAVATSLFVGLGIDCVSLQSIRRDYPDRQIVYVDGWTGKGGVASEVKRLGEGELAVLCDPWNLADFSGTNADLLSPSAFFTGPTTLGFSRTFTQSSGQPFAAYRFPPALLQRQMVDNWRRNSDIRNYSTSHHTSNSDAVRSVYHNTSLRVHSNEVCRALINSNPEVLYFRHSKTHAREHYELLLEFADSRNVPQRFDFSTLNSINVSVACSLRLGS